MTDTIYLEREFACSGTERKDFVEVLTNIEAITSQVIINPNELLVLYYLENTKEAVRFLILDCREPFTQETELKTATFPTERFSKSLLAEVKDNGLCLYNATDKRLYVLAENADFNCLGFFGNISRKNNLPRAIMFAEALRARNEDVSLMVQGCGAPVIRKCVAIRSQDYAYLPQTLIDGVVSEFEKSLGNIGSCSFEVTRELTVFTATFPDGTKPLSEVYETDFIPGVRIETSDTGESAFRITPVCQVRGKIDTEFYSPKVVSIKHFGSATPEKVITQCNSVFAEFTEIPKKLIKLMDIPLFAGYSKADKISSYHLLVDDIVTSIKLNKAVGSRATKNIVEGLKLSYDGSDLTAFDVAERFLSLPSVVVGASPSAFAKLKNAVYCVLSFDFKEDICVA